MSARDTTTVRVRKSPAATSAARPKPKIDPLADITIGIDQIKQAFSKAKQKGKQVLDFMNK